MLISCKYCGKIHEKKYSCRQKEEDIARQGKKKGTREDKFRWSGEWKRKREEIRERDSQACQICARDGRVETGGLSVHHIIPIEESWESRLEGENLITVCAMHHEAAEKGEIERKKLQEIAKEQEATDIFEPC